MSNKSVVLKNCYFRVKETGTVMRNCDIVFIDYINYGDKYDCFCEMRDDHNNNPGTVLCNEYFDEMIEDAIVNPSATKIPRGSAISYIGTLPYPMEDVRKYYTIKRKDDTGDYNVMGNIKLSRSDCNYAYSFLVCEKKNMVFCFPYDTKYKKESDHMAKLADVINELYPDIFYSDLEKAYGLNYGEYIGIYKDDSGVVDKIMANSFVKPLVSYKDLDLDSSMPLTMDTLKILYNTMLGRSVDDIKTQVNLIAQYAWKERRGALYIMMRCVRKKCGYSGAFSRYTSVKSKMSKNEILVMNDCYYHTNNVGKTIFVNEDDFNMAREFINDLIDIGDCRFTDKETLEMKLSNIGLSYDHFIRLFQHVIKVTPKKYEEYLDEYAKKENNDDEDNEEYEDYDEDDI